MYNRWDLNLCLQPLALIILKLGTIKVAVSNRSSKRICDETALFWVAEDHVFCAFDEKGPFLNLKKSCTINGLRPALWPFFFGHFGPPFGAIHTFDIYGSISARLSLLCSFKKNWTLCLVLGASKSCLVLGASKHDVQSAGKKNAIFWRWRSYGVHKVTFMVCINRVRVL